MDGLEEKTRMTDKHLKIHSASLVILDMRIWNRAWYYRGLWGCPHCFTDRNLRRGEPAERQALSRGCRAFPRLHSRHRSHNCFFTKLEHTIWLPKFFPGHWPREMLKICSQVRINTYTKVFRTASCNTLERPTPPTGERMRAAKIKMSKPHRAHASVCRLSVPNGRTSTRCQADPRCRQKTL